MRTTTLGAIMAMLMLSAGICAAGTTVSYPPDDPVLSITFPEGWKKTMDPNYDKGIIVTSPDGEIEIDLWALDETDVKQDPNLAYSIEEVKIIIREWVTDFEAGPIEAFEANGIRFVGKEGSGKSKEDGSPVDVSVYFFSPDRKTVFVLMYWGTPEAGARYKKQLNAIARSIRKP
jgi:hypothetical protein